MAVVTPSASPAFSFFAHFSPLSGQQKLAAHQILPHLFLGSATAARSACWLQENRITHILCIHNAAATPGELKQQLQAAYHRREECRNKGTHSTPRQPQSPAEQLVVHGKRCVYCCCYAVDTPQHLLLDVLSPAIHFVDNAIQDESFRGGGPSPAEWDREPRSIFPVRNHLFIAGDEQTSFTDSGASELYSYKPGVTNGRFPPAKSADARAHGNVLVHCAKGISRSASFVICYLMYRRCWSYNDSFTYIRRKRPIYPNVGFQIQLQLIQRLLEKFRPTIPRVDDGSEACPKRVTASAVAAGLVPDDEDEPDLFRRDPTAPEKLLRILEEARTALDSSSLETKLVESILTQLLAVQELVQNMFRQTALLRDRQKWEPLGLFFENLKSYTVPAAPEVLRTAEKVAKKASELKLVFTATLPGVAIADTVADEIRRWIQVASQSQPAGKKAEDEDGERKHSARGKTASAQTTAPEVVEVSRGQCNARSEANGNGGMTKLTPEITQNAGADDSPLAGTTGLFGCRTASTAATLRARLLKLKEKREQLTAKEAPDTGPGADQASSGHRDDLTSNTRNARSGSGAEHRVTRERVSSLSPEENKQRHRKELKKQKKREKKERKRMKKRLKREGRVGRLSESDYDSSECSKSSRLPGYRDARGRGRDSADDKSSAGSSISPPRRGNSAEFSGSDSSTRQERDFRADRRPRRFRSRVDRRDSGRMTDCDSLVSRSLERKRGREALPSLPPREATRNGPTVSEKLPTGCSSGPGSSPCTGRETRSPSGRRPRCRSPRRQRHDGQWRRSNSPSRGRSSSSVSTSSLRLGRTGRELGGGLRSRSVSHSPPRHVRSSTTNLGRSHSGGSKSSSARVAV